ncbi:hypothetical protein N7527_007262 [Penicillium freii]|uniref:Rhodopsin domain-containing protein n=1 Tax=Penicillium freii TaxID=48697 RepID=A0A117NKT3_PENFR|nr:hypothetical protein N7527_007262 [Penicillium freii]KUM56583.1 hypothetical protein ACN42_g10626 [Penicillium freii]
MLYGLQLTWRKKGAILGVFLGILSIAAGCVRYDFVTKLNSAKDEYYLLLDDSLNWCMIEAYVAIFCGSGPSLSVLIKTYAPSIFGSSAAKYQSSEQSPGASYVQRRNPQKSNRRRGLGDTTLGSQDGIMMKTDIQMDVATRKSTEDMTYKREYYDFAKRT